MPANREVLDLVCGALGGAEHVSEVWACLDVGEVDYGAVLETEGCYYCSDYPRHVVYAETRDAALRLLERLKRRR